MNMDVMRLIWGPLFLSMGISWIVSKLVIKVYRKIGWVVDPKKQKHPAHVHSKPVPKGGGISVFLGSVAAMMVFLPLDGHLIAIILAGLLLLSVGVWDDARDISPILRLLVNFLAAGIVIGAGIGIAYITNPFGSGVIHLNQPQLSFHFLGEQRSIWLLADLLALLWIPFMINSVNWSSGLDGQIAGVVPIAAATIGVLSFRFGADVTQWPVAIAAFSLAGAFLGYLPYSFYPQKSMPGYGGAGYAGFMLAVLAILSTTKVGTAMVVLGVPLIDAIYVGVSRILKGKLPWKGGREHLHHKLMDLGWGKRRIAVFYWLVTGLLGLIALSLNSRQKLYTMVAIAVILGGFFIWVSQGHLSELQDQDNG